MDLFFAGFELPLIALEQVSLLETPIGTDEIAEAIDCLKLNKSPSLDGLMAEFYKRFKPILLPHLQQLFAECLKEKKILPSWA